jgi:phenylalanyl-tRNA synthetase beta chain
MKISLAWLNDYLEPPVAAEAVEPLLTAQGFPIEDTVAVEDGPAAGDTMFDVEVTSNRGDCLSHLGVAREIAAGSDARLKRPETPQPGAGPDAVGTLATVQVDEPEACPVYTARVITGLTVKPSPDWLVARLDAVGLRSVNNVVDVTNFVLHEMGQPLHAFDLGRLSGREITVRHAAPGEAFNAIDGSRHELRDGMLVIADGQQPQAVAGVMGGRDSEVTEQTTEVLLESAIFAPLSVRTTGRALKLASDSSFRYERGVDPAGVERASRRAAALIVQVAGGQVAEGVIRVGKAAPDPKRDTLTVPLRLGRLRSVMGIDFSRQQVMEYLHQRLGLADASPPTGDTLEFAIPTYRLDLRREIDLIEEVARLHGMASIPVKPKLELTARPPQDTVRARRILAEVLVGHGYHETITFSFIRPAYAKPFLPAESDPLVLEGDHKKDEPMLRPSVLPSLLQCRKLNQDVGNRDVKLFEIASTWHVQSGETIENVRLALLRDAEQPDAALRELRGTLEEILEALGGPMGHAALTVDASTDDAVMSPAAVVKLEGQPVGRFGLLNQASTDPFGLQTPQAGLEVELPRLLDLYPPRRAIGELPRFPGIERDLSLIVEEAVTWQQITAAVEQAQPDLLEEVGFLGVYRGKPIERGRKSVSLRLLFRDSERTLRHEQVDPQVAAVVAELKQKLSAELRG